MPVERARFRRRALSMTSLVDVIFLLLLFFMLSSTFARHGEIALSAAAQGGAAPADRPPVFLRLTPEGVSLNGLAVALDALAATLAEAGHPPEIVLALAGEVPSQALVDVLAVLRQVPGRAVTVVD